MTRGQGDERGGTGLALAAASGLVSVLAGAFGAHGAADPTARDLIRTGAQYEAIHALAVFACAVFTGAAARRARLAPPLFLMGSLLFSGSLFALALGAPRWTGAITPLGGLSLIAGWGVLIWAAGAKRHAA